MLRLTFLGTGCPAVYAPRAGSALMLETAGARILVDCGSGVTTRLVEAGTTGAAIDALIITHLHTDHLIDFYQLVISSWHQGRNRPWRVHAPKPAIAVMQALMAAWDGERRQRIAHEKRPGTAGLDVEFVELTEAPIQVGDCTLAPFLVDHRPVEPAFGLAATDGASRIVLSGDTRPCPALESAAKGADLLVHEVFVTRDMPVTAGVRSPETVQAVESYHTTPADVARLASASGIGALALTHLVPPATDQARLIADIRAGGYSGPCFVAEDLMVVTPALRMVRYQGATLGY